MWIAWLAVSESPTISASVLDLVTIFCFADFENTGPDLMVTAHPVWDRLESVCTPYAVDVRTYQERVAHLQRDPSFSCRLNVPEYAPELGAVIDVARLHPGRQ